MGRSLKVASHDHIVRQIRAPFRIPPGRVQHRKYPRPPGMPPGQNENMPQRNSFESFSCIKAIPPTPPPPPKHLTQLTHTRKKKP